MFKNKIINRALLLGLLTFTQATTVYAVNSFPCDRAQQMIDALVKAKGEILDYKKVNKEGNKIANSFAHDPVFEDLTSRIQGGFNNYIRASHETTKTASQLVNKMTLFQNRVANDMLTNNCGDL